MRHEHWRYRAHMLKDRVGVSIHWCFFSDGVCWEIIQHGKERGLTSPIDNTHATESIAVKEMLLSMLKQRSEVLGTLARLNRRIPACQHHLKGLDRENKK